MRRSVITLIICLMALATTATAANDRKYTLQTMQRVFDYTASIDTAKMGRRESYAYLKYSIRTNRRNCILLAIPTMFAVAHAGEREHFGETYDKVIAERPGDLRAERLLDHTTIPHNMKTMPTLLKYLTPRPYEEMIVDGRIMSPMHRRNRSYYNYEAEELSTKEAMVFFSPRINNTKLVRGWARVNTRTGRIIETAFDGEYDMVRFHVALTMGVVGVQSLLPKDCSLNTRFLFMGNDITSEYTSVYALPPVLPDSVMAGRRHDAALIDSVRPIPLTPHEELLLARHGLISKLTYNTSLPDSLANDTTKQRRHNLRWAKRLWDNVGRNVLERTKANFGKDNQGYFRLSPILNPLYCSYSSTRGFTYKFDLQASYAFNHEQSVHARFKAGYAFKQKQLYFNLPLTYNFNRRHNGWIVAEWAGGRQIVSSEVVDAVKKERSDSINWDAMNLTYFRDHCLRIVGNYDFTQKWGMELGMTVHVRSAIHPEGFDVAGKDDTYTSVAPTLGIKYRPAGLRGPVFTADYERSIRGLLGSNTAFERFEFSGQYIHRFTALANLQMRAGCGFYTHKGDDSYFLDYSNFYETNVPGGWNDDWACSFELLNSHWYNASEYYVRANAAYESPLLMLSRVPWLGRLVERERIYINAITVRHLHPYIEYGYGFQCRMFSLGAFVAQSNWRFDGFAVRFGLELFRHW